MPTDRHEGLLLKTALYLTFFWLSSFNSLPSKESRTGSQEGAWRFCFQAGIDHGNEDSQPYTDASGCARQGMANVSAEKGICHR